MNETEVLIVGAGPSGLMMACQLAIQGIRYRIIDKKENATSHSGALIIQARSIEIFNQMGIAQKFIQEGIIARQINIHFKGKPLRTISLNNFGSGLSGFPFLLLVKQAKTEEILTEIIKERGHIVERGIELLNVYQDSTGVTAVLKNPDGCIESLKSAYLIGADGGKSLIRQQLKIPFTGKVHKTSLYIIDCKADIQSSQGALFIAVATNSISGFFPLSEGKWRIDGVIPKTLQKKAHLTFEDIANHFSERNKTETRIYDPEWFSVFYSRQHFATTFQTERCFLIGDAAHIHSPVGAQGMNSGLQDACNLSWKLAFVLREKSGHSLLKTYTRERLPVAKKTVRTTGHIFNLLTGRSIMNQLFQKYLFPYIVNTWFPIVERKKIINSYLFKSVSQTGIHYRKSILSHKPATGILPFQNIKAGDRLPFFTFKENGCEVNIQEKVKATALHLFVFSKFQLSENQILKLEKYHNILTFESILKTEENENLFHSLDIEKNGLLVVRPDLHVAFYSKTLNFRALEIYLKYFQSN